MPPEKTFNTEEFYILQIYETSITLVNAILFKKERLFLALGRWGNLCLGSMGHVTL